MKYELIEFYCPKCGKYNNIMENKTYEVDCVVCSTCNTKLDIDFDFDENFNLTNVTVSELKE